MLAHCGVPGNEEADSLANEGRLDIPLYLLPAATGVTSAFLDDDDRTAQVLDMLEDFSFLEQSPCLDTVDGCLNFDSDSDGDLHDWEGGTGRGHTLAILGLW